MREEIAEEKEVVKVERTVIQKIVKCNKCGHSSQGTDRDSFYDSRFQNVDCSFGYGSDYDMEAWNFDLCEECLTEFIKTFKHVPDGFMLDNSYMTIETKEEHQKVFEEWQKTGEWEELRFKTYEELVKLSKVFNVSYINEVIKKFHKDKPLLESDEYEEG